MQIDRRLIGVSLGEVFARQQLSDRDLATQLKDVREAHLRKPVAVAMDFCPGNIDHLADWVR